MNKRFDNIDPTHTDNTIATVMMTLTQFNMEPEFVYAQEQRSGGVTET